METRARTIIISAVVFSSAVIMFVFMNAFPYQALGAVATFMGESDQIHTQKVVVDQINRLDGGTGLVWLTDKTIIVNTDKGMMVQNLETGQRTPWEGPSGVVWLSPNRKHAFIASSKEGDKYDLTGAIVDLVSKRSIPVALSPGIITGGWTDNQNFIFSNVMAEGPITKVNVDGKVTPIALKNGDQGVLSLKPKGDTLYYLTGVNGDTLRSYRLGTSEAKTIGNGIKEFAPSPDGKLLAVAKSAPTGGQSLQLIQPDGKERGPVVAKGDLIERL